MRLHDLKPAPGAVRRRKRVGRGPSSGHGKTSGRGTKGQKSRENVRPGFEGGQTPLHRRLPKRRGSGKGAMPTGMLRPRYVEVNVGQLERLEAGTEVTAELLKEQRIIRKIGDGLRVLGGGELTKPLTVKAVHFTASARAKIEAAGGTAEVV